MPIRSRNDLLQYALRKLGHPVIKISVAEEQAQDRIDEALQFFQDFHYDATERVYLKHQVTGTKINVASTANFIKGEFVQGASGAKFLVENIDSPTQFTTRNVYLGSVPAATFTIGENLSGLSSGAITQFVSKVAGETETGFIPVSEMVQGVIKIIPWWTVFSGGDSYLFDPKYQAVLATFKNLSSSSVIYYDQMMSHLNLIDQVLYPIESLRFNRKMAQIYVDYDWNTAKIGGYLVVEAYRILDPEVFTTIYDDRMLKKLVTAKIKYQWAQNLSLYAGVQLLGGVTVDAASLKAEAVAELSSAEDEIREIYGEPTIGFVG